MKNQENVVICPPCGEQSLAPEGFNPGVAVATKEGQNRNKTSWPLLPRLAAVLPPQGREMRRGFTLIELLVVVLIIGILAAVALPQYQAAVLKSKAQHGIITLDALAKAQQIYYLTHGQYAENLEALDIQTEEDIRGSSKATLGIIRVASDLSIEYVWGWNPMQRRCIAYSVRGHKVCQSLGGRKMNHPDNTDSVTYYKLP